VSGATARRHGRDRDLRLAGEREVFLHGQAAPIDVAAAMAELLGEAQALASAKTGVVADLEKRWARRSASSSAFRGQRQRDEAKKKTGGQAGHH